MSYKYDVALSYAGEQRHYVEKVVDFLKQQQINVFYDIDKTVEIWGENLIEYLENVYFSDSKYCVVFLSNEYINKPWTRHELEASLNRKLLERINDRLYVLPVLFDNVIIPRLSRSTAYLNANDFTPKELGKMVFEKIRGSKYMESNNIVNLSEVYETIVLSFSNFLENRNNSKLDVDISQCGNQCSFRLHKSEVVFYFICITHNSRKSHPTLQIYSNKLIPTDLADSISADIIVENNKLYILNYDFVPLMGYCKIETNLNQLIKIMQEKVMPLL